MKPKKKGRMWTEEQKQRMSAWQTRRHQGDEAYHKQALEGLDKGRKSRKLPFTEEEREVYYFTKNKMGQSLSPRKRALLIQSILDARDEQVEEKSEENED